ncbi:MAG: hypothetical protein ACFFCX_12110 [Candidatus Sifarchaeia archaeon]
MSKSSFVEFVTISVIFLFILPIMFTLIVIVLLNSAIAVEIRIAQTGLIVLVSGSILHGSVTYFLQKMKKQVVNYQKEIG